MNLHALRLFIEVASRKSVSQTAEVLSLTQPAITAQIRNLEKEIGMKLVAPNGRGIQLTRAGEFLYNQAQRLFYFEKEIERKLEELKKGEIGSLRISSTYSPSTFFLPVWLAKYKLTYPLVDVQLRIGNSQKVIKQLLHFEADAAIITKEDWKEINVNRVHLMNENFWFIVPRDHPFANKEVTLVELMKEPFLLREEGSSTREKILTLCKTHNVEPPKSGLQFHGIIESIHSVVAGYGTTLAPEIAVRELIIRGEVGRVYVKGIDISRPIYFCTRNDEEVTSTIKQFLQTIKTLIKFVV